MRILILDDDLNRHTEFANRLIGCNVTHVETSKDAIQKLKEEFFDVLFLDHDLGGQVYVDSGINTGFEVADWLSRNESRKPTRIIIHSFNACGAQNMKAVLPTAEIIPGAWGLIELEEPPSVAESLSTEPNTGSTPASKQASENA